MMNEPLSVIMTSGLITAKPTDKASYVENVFRFRNIHHLPIVDDSGKLVGMVSTNDLYKIAHQFNEFDQMTASDIMRHHLVTLEPNAKVGTASEIFLQNLFHAIPVVDANYILKGLVTTHDLLKYSYSKEYPDSFWLKKSMQ